ncbi:MAG TPA: hypothetical protein VMA77_23900 [Solirubrobacteraceae bacterium]|nr:hypothetical protein [Solirubrobacteraceae bacterium]
MIDETLTSCGARGRRRAGGHGRHQGAGKIVAAGDPGAIDGIVELLPDVGAAKVVRLR